MSTIEPEQTVVSMESAYKAAHGSAVIVDRSELGMLKFVGETRLDLINRMSTQQVIGLHRGEGTATILTSDIGRIIDRLILYASSDAVYCLTSENNGENIANYLRRFVFYMDDFTVEDLSAETAMLAVYGHQAKPMMANLFGEAAELSLFHWKRCELAGITFYLHRTDPVAGDGYFITCSMDDKVAVWRHLVAAGITPASAEMFEYLRIESGLPRFGRELTTDYIPLEANLWSDVSFNKGCYTGQEIIARMESRGRLAKKLVRLRASGPVQIGDELNADGKKAGTITSAGDGPAGFLALGYVRTAVLNDPTSSEGWPKLEAGPVTVEVAEDS